MRKKFCWWCKKELSTTDTKCDGCGAPFTQKLREATAPKTLIDVKGWLVEFFIILVSGLIAVGYIENVEFSEGARQQSQSPISVPTPAPTPSPSPQPTRRRRKGKGSQQYPIPPSEQAPSPNIPDEEE